MQLGPQLLLGLLPDLLLKVEFIGNAFVEELSAFSQRLVAELKRDLFSKRTFGTLIQKELLKILDLMAERLQLFVLLVPELLSNGLIVLLQEHHANLLGGLLVLNAEHLQLALHLLLQTSEVLLAYVANRVLVKGRQSSALALREELFQLFLEEGHCILEALVEIAFKGLIGVLIGLEALILADVGPAALD